MDYRSALKAMCRNLINVMTAYEKLKYGVIKDWEFYQVLQLAFRDAANTLNYLNEENKP